MQHRFTRAALITLMLAAPAYAADAPPPKPESGDTRLAMLPADSVTHHTITAHGQKLAYTATAGTLKMRDEKGEPTAEIFYVAYTLNGAATGYTPGQLLLQRRPGRRQRLPAARRRRTRKC